MFPAIVPPEGFRCILIEDLRLQLFIGVNPEEKAARQGVSVSMYMMVRDSGPALSDVLADHVSYAEVVAKLRERGRSSRHVNLVETLAEESAEYALAEPRVDSVVVAVRKLSVVAEAKGVGVVIHRRRGG
jgi:FolB domain-containing protein